jgi:Na+/glutamate symporter
MIYLLPFFNAFALFISLNEGQILYKYFEWLKSNIFTRLPIPDKVLGGCILCTSFWMGYIELTAVKYYNFNVPINEALTIILLVCYNAVITDIAYKFLKSK